MCYISVVSALANIAPETATRCLSNLNLCSKNRVFLSDGFQKCQKICDFICPGAWFLDVNLGSTTFVLLWLTLLLMYYSSFILLILFYFIDTYTWLSLFMMIQYVSFYISRFPWSFPKLYCENKHQYKEVNHIVIIIVDCQHEPEI